MSTGIELQTVSRQVKLQRSIRHEDIDLLRCAPEFERPKFGYSVRKPRSRLSNRIRRKNFVEPGIQSPPVNAREGLEQR